MNQREFIRLISKKTDISSLEIEFIIEEMASTIGEALIEGEKVSITKLGSFKLKERKERNGYDPYHGVMMEIPVRKKIIFECSKYLKEKLVVTK